MSLSIYCPDESASVPKPVVLRLICDSENCPHWGAVAEFDCRCYPTARRKASELGWLIRDYGDDLCPSCSGKPCRAPEPVVS